VLLDALEAALAADPYGAVAKYVKRSGDGVEVAGRRYELSGAVHIVGFSKVALRDAEASGVQSLRRWPQLVVIHVIEPKHFPSPSSGRKSWRSTRYIFAETFAAIGRKTTSRNTT